MGVALINPVGDRLAQVKGVMSENINSAMSNLVSRPRFYKQSTAI